MKHVSVLIKPASSLCNLRCKYCFYDDVSNFRQIQSFGIMKNEIMAKMIDNIYVDLEMEDTIIFAFQGGEPTLAGLSYFEEFIKYVNTKKSSIKVKYSIQTNGILINEEWCKFLAKNDFLIGLSIDCEAHFHDINRIDINKAGSYNRVMTTKKLFNKYKIQCNVLCVLTNQIAQHPKRVFNFLKKNKIKFVQFIPCLDELHVKNKNIYTLTPENFANFYIQIYKYWEKEFINDNYMSIKLFDDVANLLIYGYLGACGLIGKCQIQYIIEADGSVYPCDFYAIDEYKMGNITKQTLKELFESSVVFNFISESREDIEKCKQCEFFKICRGGCRRMKSVAYWNKENTYCGYYDFLKNIVNRLYKIE